MPPPQPGKYAPLSRRPPPNENPRSAPGTGNTLMKVSDRYDTYFCRYERVNPKDVDFRENLTFELT